MFVDKIKLPLLKFSQLLPGIIPEPPMGNQSAAGHCGHFTTDLPPMDPLGLLAVGIVR